MGLSYGSVIEIKKQDGEWKAMPYLKLPSAPSRVAPDSQGNLIIVTSSSLLRIDSTKRIDVLINEGFWQTRLYPHSLLVKDDLVYIGMRKGVLRFKLATRKQEWLMPE